MRIETVKIENFLGISEAELSLDNRGLLLIQGENRDDPSAKSNGAGKSTIPDAISWCLFGKTARGVSSDDVINDVGLLQSKIKYYLSNHTKKTPTQQKKKKILPSKNTHTLIPSYPHHFHHAHSPHQKNSSQKIQLL